MPILRVVGLDRRKIASCVLGAYAENVHSQFGEDGIIGRIFEIIGEESRWCVEVGAWDGLHFSNTCHLVRDRGWNGVEIEGSAEKFAELEANFAQMPNAHPMQAVVGFTRGTNALDDLLATTPIPQSFDLLSIDVDGCDYHVWRATRRFRPRAVVIEFNPTVPNDVVFVQDPDLSVHQGCSLLALIELGKRKGYELVATTNANAFFVEVALFAKFAIEDNSIDALRKNVIGRIFHGYDGTVFTKMRPLQWTGCDGRRPAIDEFQLLSPDERRFDDALPQEAG